MPLDVSTRCVYNYECNYIYIYIYVYTRTYFIYSEIERDAGLFDDSVLVTSLQGRGVKATGVRDGGFPQYWRGVDADSHCC